MTVTELFPLLKQLSCADNLMGIRFLIAELVNQDKSPTLEPDAVYPVWTPLNSHIAAYELGELLEASTY